MDVRQEQVAEKVGGFGWQLSRHVVDGADQDAGPLERLLVLVAVGVVEAEGLVDGGALVHELNRASWIGADVANADQAVRQSRRALITKKSQEVFFK